MLKLRKPKPTTIKEKVIIALLTKLFIITPCYLGAGLYIAISDPTLTTTQVHIVMINWIISVLF